MIREFDERLGWAKWGLESCAEWLAWRCDISTATAREKVRVAFALRHTARHAAERCRELKMGDTLSVGIAVPQAGYRSQDMVDTDTGEISSLYNHPPRGGFLSIAEKPVSEPPPPVYWH